MFVQEKTDSLVKEKLVMIERKGVMSKGERMKSKAQVIGLAIDWNGDTSSVVTRSMEHCDDTVMDHCDDKNSGAL